ncbi:MAG: CoA-binding protein [Xanthomonadaceae bacterium]|nr:CoA-binding protein [Xanthomonadaceae bacterium]
MAFTNPTNAEIAARLQQVRNIAVIGLSPTPTRPSFGVSEAMQRAGLRIIPVRPGVESVLGERAWATLAEVPDRIDLVNVFRAPEHVPAIVEEVLRLGIPALWLQDGVIDAPSAERAQAAGVFVVMDRCLKRDGLPLVNSTASKGGK